MNDKVILITGSTAGIGKAAAIELAKSKATIVITAKDNEKGKATVEEIKKISGNNNVEFLDVDLSSQESIKRAVEKFKQKYSKLDVLINCAGVFLSKRMESVDGLELMFATNYFAYFMLTNLLLSEIKMAKTARIINVSAPAFVKPKFDDLQGIKKFNPTMAFGVTKAEGLLFTYELARRLKNFNITVNAFHPGITRTGLLNNAPLPFKIFGKLLNVFVAIPVEKAGKQLARLALSDEFNNITGQLIHNGKPIKATYVGEIEMQKKLWDISESLKK